MQPYREFVFPVKNIRCIINVAPKWNFPSSQRLVSCLLVLLELKIINVYQLFCADEDSPRIESQIRGLWYCVCLCNVSKVGDSQGRFSFVYVRSQDLSVIHFYAPWADQCSQINDVLEEMSKLGEYKRVKFAKIEAEKVPDVSLKAGITAVPTVVLARNDAIVDRVDGANPSAIGEKVKQHSVNSKDTIPIDMCKPKESLEDRLKKLTSQEPCMLFMKGNPANPRCGFSRTIISILDSYKADYKTFDILQDNDVREGLKKFSNWPTYPQLYLNGELIGGLDIVREMSEAGELESMLPKKS